MVSESHHLSAIDFAQAMNQPLARVVDIRTPAEWLGGVICAEGLFLDCYADDFVSSVEKLDPQYCYLLYCRSGVRTLMGLHIFAQYGYDCAHLAGGIIEWCDQGYSLVSYHA